MNGSPANDITVTTADPLITETLTRLLDEHCSPEAVQAAEASGWAEELWQAFSEIGFAHISIPESAGGSGGTLLDALEVLRLLGYYAAPIPAAETSILGGWLLSEAGLELPDSSRPLAVPTRTTSTPTVEGAAGADSMHSAEPLEVKLNGSLTSVPWASAASRIVFVAAGNQDTAASTAGASTTTGADNPHGRLNPQPALVVSVDPAKAKITPKRNLAGEPRDTVSFDNTSATACLAPPSVSEWACRLRGSLSRAALMAGALQKMTQLTVSYTNDRIQFGRPVARFQAVQQHLVWGAQDAALLGINAQVAGLAAYRALEDAAAGATATSGADINAAEFEIGAVKLLANQAAARATKASHQAHGAMGMTQEYPLHHLSRRLWSWRLEYGVEAECAGLLGAIATSQGADGLYPLITSGQAR